jgi:hypothetical protein
MEAPGQFLHVTRRAADRATLEAPDPFQFIPLAANDRALPEGLRGSRTMVYKKKAFS